MAESSLTVGGSFLLSCYSSAIAFPIKQNEQSITVAIKGKCTLTIFVGSSSEVECVCMLRQWFPTGGPRSVSFKVVLEI